QHHKPHITAIGEKNPMGERPVINLTASSSAAVMARNGRSVAPVCFSTSHHTTAKMIPAGRTMKRRIAIMAMFGADALPRTTPFNDTPSLLPADYCQRELVSTSSGVRFGDGSET